MSTSRKKEIFDSSDTALKSALDAIRDGRLSDLDKIMTAAYPRYYEIEVQDFNPPDGGCASAEEAELYTTTRTETREQLVRCIHSDNLWVILLAAAEKSQKAFERTIKACEKDSQGLGKFIEDFLPRYRDTYHDHWDKNAVKGLVRASAVALQSSSGAEKHARRMGYNDPTIAASLTHVDGIRPDTKAFLEGVADPSVKLNLPDPNALITKLITDLQILKGSQDSMSLGKSIGKTQQRKDAVATALAQAIRIEKNDVLEPYDKLVEIVGSIVVAQNSIREAIESGLFTKKSTTADNLLSCFTKDGTQGQLSRLGIDVAIDPKSKRIKVHCDAPDRYRGATMKNMD